MIRMHKNQSTADGMSRAAWWGWAQPREPLTGWPYNLRHQGRNGIRLAHNATLQVLQAKTCREWLPHRLHKAPGLWGTEQHRGHSFVLTVALPYVCKWTAQKGCSLNTDGNTERRPWPCPIVLSWARMWELEGLPKSLGGQVRVCTSEGVRREGLPSADVLPGTKELGLKYLTTLLKSDLGIRFLPRNTQHKKTKTQSR